MSPARLRGGPGGRGPQRLAGQRAVTEWMDTQDDDVTVLVVRYGAPGAAVTAAA